MLALIAAFALQAAAPAPAPAPGPAPPDPEKLALGERLARAGLLDGLMNVAAAGEARGVVDAHEELTPEQRAKAQAVAAAALADAKAEVAHAEARAFAATLTLDQMRAAAAFFESPAGTAYRSAFPFVLMGITQAGPAKDFRGYVTRRVCDEAQVCPAGK